MKRFFILLFVLLMLCSFGCSAGQWLMTTLDGDWRELHFNIDNITEILVTAPDKSEALLISDPAEIESILKNAKQVSFQSGNYTPFDGTYTVRVYENDLLVACLHPEEPHLYNPAFGKVLSRLMKRLKNGDYNCYAYRLSVPKGVHYDDAAEYLNKCGYDTRYFNSNNPYPYLILSYSACEEDMMRYSETELTKHCTLGTFEPDTNLAVFTEELRREGYVKSYSTVSEKERRYVHGELEFIKRGIYIYLTKYLTEEEITTLQARAEKASLEWTYLYTGFYSEACEDTLLLSESPIDESQLAAIETGLSALDNDDNLYEEADTSALLYEGEGLKIYYTYRQGEPGICVEAANWSRTDAWFLTLPFTKGLTNIVFTGVETKPDGDQEEALVYIRYLDDTGTERLICADHRAPEYTVVYPLSTGSSLVLNDEQRNLFNDLLLIGYMYTHFEAEKDRLNNPDNPGGWESLCQRRILDALYQNYNDTLPPYLKGEETIHSPYDGKITIITQEELENFFQSTVGRPCLVQDRRHMYYDEPMEELLPGQVPMPETDYYCNGHVRQAVKEPDGTICLYGYRSGFEVMYESVICRIRPIDGYLGGQVVSTEVFPVYYIHNDPSIILAPIDNKN